MKLPETPPDIRELFIKVVSSADKFMDIIGKYNKVVDVKGSYAHWDKLKHTKPPTGMSTEEYWFAIKHARMARYQKLPLLDKAHTEFNMLLTDSMNKTLFWIEKNASGNILMEGDGENHSLGNSYIYNSAIEEAISSSQLEGAATTRRVAKDMLKAGRAPTNKHEQMIFNNYQAMTFIKSIANYDLTPTLVLELHSILTEGTFGDEDNGFEGKLRTTKDDICVHASDNTIVHIPPVADELEERLQRLCDFANEDTEDGFIPNIVKAIILHFMIGYDHPFVDGNGRTARALFYWYLMKHAYWLMEYTSISRVLKQAPGQYMRSYLHTENDDSDLTYFIEHQINVIKQAIEDVQSYLSTQRRKIESIKKLINQSGSMKDLNLRQVKLLENLIDKPGYEFDIKQHEKEFGISNQTARTDLLKLSDTYKILRRRKVGNKDIFYVPSNILQNIQFQGL